MEDSAVSAGILKGGAVCHLVPQVAYLSGFINVWEVPPAVQPRAKPVPL